MQAFATNIRYLRNKKGLSQQALADEFDLTRGQLASYEDNRAEPSQETLIKYSAYFKLPIDALIKNDLTGASSDVFIEIGNNRILFPVIITEKNENSIEVVPIKASAGYPIGYSDPQYISSLPQMHLPFVPTGKHRAFPIKGDSMEPWVRDGSFVVSKFIENVDDIKSANTYVIVTKENGITYKRIYLDKMKEGVLILKSDNSFYKPYELPVNEIIEIWEYTCKIDMQNYDPSELNLNSIMQMMRSFQVELAELKEKLS